MTFTVPIRIDNAGADAAIAKVTNELDRLERTSKAAGEIVSKALQGGKLHADQAAEATRRYAHALAEAERNAERTAAASAKIARSGLFEGALNGAGLSALAGGTAGIAAIATQKVIELGHSVVGLGEAYTNLDNRLKSIAPIEEQRLDLMERTRTVANASRADWAATNELFVRLTSSTKEMGLSQERVLSLTETISKTFAKSGASSAEAAAGMLQLSQAFASGRLQGDEFKSLSESVPDILDLIAKQMGVTRGELKALSSEGKITGDVLVATFENAKGQIDSGFAKTAPTLSQSFAQFKNDMTAVFGPLLQDLLPRVAAKMQEVAAYVTTIVDKAKSVGGGIGTAINADVGGISARGVFDVANSAFNPAEQARALEKLNGTSKEDIELKKEQIYLYVQSLKTGKDWVNVLIDESQQMVKNQVGWGQYKTQLEQFLEKTREIANPAIPTAIGAWTGEFEKLASTINVAAGFVDNLTGKLLGADFVRGRQLVADMFGQGAADMLQELSVAGEQAEGGWAATRRDPADTTGTRRRSGGRARAKKVDTWADTYVSNILDTLDGGFAEIKAKLAQFNELKATAMGDMGVFVNAGVRGVGALAGGPSYADIANDPNFLKPAEEALSTRQANEAKRQAYVLQRQTEQFKEYEKIATQSLSRVEDAFVRLFTTGEFGAKKMFQAIMADLTRMATHQLLMSLLGAALGPGPGITWANGQTSAYGLAHGGVFHAAHGLSYRIGGSSTVGDKVPFFAMVNSGEDVTIRSRFQQQEAAQTAAGSVRERVVYVDSRRQLTTPQDKEEIIRVALEAGFVRRR